MKEINLGDLGVFVEALEELKIKTPDVPKNLKIPNWPEAAGAVTISLGRRECVFPTQSVHTAMFRMDKETFMVTFNLRKNGTFAFRLMVFVPNFFKGEHLEDYSHHSTETDSYYDLYRMQALVLFHQFQEEICAKLIEKLKADLPEHDRTMEMVEKAMAPFIPFLVADTLS
ncbi:MAG: hypothetical protein HYT94_03785 [Parcubacteria group bacterium]|nr:hypothetical protein [Parcubacteria group bacterium]